jgi:excisionase family DNA binding protein
MQDYLSTRQLAQRLGVTPETIRQWTKNGRIPELRINHKVRRFDPVAVDAAIREHGSLRGVAK